MGGWVGVGVGAAEGLNQFYSHETSPLILMQHKITHICLVRIWVLYLICETSQKNKYNKNVKYHSETHLIENAYEIRITICNFVEYVSYLTWLKSVHFT